MQSGGTESDKLFGGASNDKLYGGDGNDEMDGGIGNDLLVGCRGFHHFVFRGGVDTVSDFSDNFDTLRLDDALWGGGPSSARVLLDFADADSSGNVIFTFSSGQSLVIRGLSDPKVLADDISIIQACL